MGLTLLGLVTALAVLPALLRWGRPMLAGTALFAVANGALLARVQSDLAAVPDPGPDARALAVLFLVPSAAFVLAMTARGLLGIARALRARHGGGD